MKKKVHREPLTSDVIFKAVFGRDTPGCKRALIGLLNRILEREEDPIVDLVYQNPFSMAELEEEKEIIMDILVETQSGEQIDIEMQIGTTKDLMNRFLYYLSKLVVRGLEKGEDYGKLKKSIVIVILRDTYFPESEPPHSCFMLKSRETGKILSEMMQLHILELGKYQWEEKEAEELNPLEVLSAYRMSKEMYQIDQAIRMRTAKEQGIEQGRIKGRIEVAKKMKARGMSVEEIAELTGLSPQEIENL